ncbi:hypothetical protein [Flavobacterium chungangense]|uniref:hypothetical protein n=1 Tax=Flavobacterium chungangense TaxID=554283 RepID=UPI0004DF4F6F|nr:hypothetical protein [Flavobacterium chungangense]
MKKILFLLLFCFLFSCEKKEPNFSEDMIEKLSVMQEYKDGKLLPSIYLGLDLYGFTKTMKFMKPTIMNYSFFIKSTILKNLNPLKIF